MRLEQGRMMNRLIAWCSKLKYLGLLGLPTFFSDAAIWRFLWLFWLFGLVELAFTLPIQIQAFRQLVGMAVVHVAHRFRLPDKDSYQAQTRYSLPFDGPWTVVNGGNDRETSHSWAIVPQRYAYDFVILDDSGSSCSGDRTVLTNYYCYGKPVLAAADGTVVELKDQYPDSRVYGDGRTDHSARDLRGNYVVIQHADKEYSVTAHLLPQSVTVGVGTRVKRGECIARCGNSGNTSEPHIHFQIQDGKSFFSSAGLPVLFQNILVAEARNYSKFDPRPAPGLEESGALAIQRGYCVANDAANGQE